MDIMLLDNKKNLFQLFSHQLTSDQQKSARENFLVTCFQMPPDEIQQLWSQVPPDTADIATFLTPVKTWLAETSQKGDIVLIQGDFGATYLMVNHAFSLGLVPVYATTQRQAREKMLSDGSIKMAHIFSFKRFRIYGQ
jgi:hypothetical protein